MNFTKKQTEEVLCNFIAKKNGLHTVLEMVLNAMMSAERASFLSDDPENKGNGYRQIRALGHGHQFELQIPRDRLSQFYPKILALFREQESYFKDVAFKLYCKGLTTRDVSDIMETIYGGSYSKSKISDISVSFYDQMEQWRNRPLEKHYLALFIDGIHVKLKRDNEYKTECFYVILGLREDYKREVLSIVNFPQESASAWELIFDEIKNRGIDSVGLVVSDSLTGIDNAISKKFHCPHQKCIVHLHKNLALHVRSTDRKELANDLRELLNVEDKQYRITDALREFDLFKAKWRTRYKYFGKYLDNLNIQPYLTFLSYDVRIRRMIYTTNWIERFNKSARRTLKIRGAFPNADSVLALITSVAIDMTEGHYSYPIYNFKFEEKLHRPSILKAKESFFP